MKYVIFGSGGVAQELVDFLQQDQHEITAVVSKTPFNDERYNNLNIIEKISVGEFPDSRLDRKSTRLNSSHSQQSRMPSSA